VITPFGAGITALAEHAPGLVEAILGVYVSLIVILVLAGSMHPDERIRADAQKVLDRLLGLGRGRAEP
jgi:hypothetical protein